MRMSLFALAPIGLALAGSACPAEEPKSPPAIRIRLVRPDEQARELIGLFEGSKAASPAAALAAWKRASAEPNKLGKPLEALIAALNPRMAGELKTLDDTEVSIRFDPESGQPTWSAILPNDDGTFAALATALVLSGGAPEAPLGNLGVDRLGPRNSPLMARDARGTFLSGSRDGLKLASERLDVPAQHCPMDGIRVLLEPGSLKWSHSLMIQRFEEMLRSPAGGLFRESSTPVEFDVALVDNGFYGSLMQGRTHLVDQPRIDPAWLDWIPSDRAMVAFASSTDPSPKSWDALFGLADRVEKLDPKRGEVASVQIRLDLLARMVGLRAEADILLHLKGVSGWVGSNGKEIDAGFVALHLDDREAADRILAKVKPMPGFGPAPPAEAGHRRSLGVVEGQTIRISRDGRSVIVTWGGGVLEASIRARDIPEKSAGPLLREFWQPELKTTMAGGVWPGRIPGVWPQGSPLAKALADSPPMVAFVARDDVLMNAVVLTWRDLDATIKRFLDLIPLDPPPDR